MLNHLQILDYRVLGDVSVEHLTRFNLVMGPGGIGKTSLLEAVFLLSGNADPDLVARCLRLRGIDLSTYGSAEMASAVNGIFSVGSRQKAVKISGAWDGLSLETSFQAIENDLPGTLLKAAEESSQSRRQSVRQATPILRMTTVVAGELHEGEIHETPAGLMITSGGGTPAFVARLNTARSVQDAPFAPLWSAVEARGEDTKVVQMLRLYDPAITGMRIVALPTGQAVLKVNHKRLGSVQLPVMGEGFLKAVMHSASIGSVPNGILLIDEIENSLYVGILRPVLRHLYEAAVRLNVQVFATSHSLEALDLLLEIAGDDLSVLQMYRTPTGPKVNRFSGQEADSLRGSIGADLRRTQ